jgi:hypothetical protein
MRPPGRSDPQIGLARLNVGETRFNPNFSHRSQAPSDAKPSCDMAFSRAAQHPGRQGVPVQHPTEASAAPADAAMKARFAAISGESTLQPPAQFGKADRG